MITWMQRHKKYLIITIWISTIAFVGAGFVGWGQYSYGEKSTAVAKVGDVKISRADFQKEYSNLYAQYNQLFQGNFDEEKAKQFGLQRQALKQLIDKAALLNLASEYDLSVSDSELLAAVTSQKYFYKDGKFDKETYKQVLSRNRISVADYEADLKRQILIQKLLKMFPVEENANEKKILPTLVSIADKVKYKVLTKDMLGVEVNDKLLKTFWSGIKNNYMTDVVYEVEYVKQVPVKVEHSENELQDYYAKNKLHFKDADGKILSYEDAKQDIVKELDKKATKEKALRNYVAFKKNKLDSSIKVEKTSVSKSHNIFNDTMLEKLAKTMPTAPYVKPVDVDGVFYIVKLVTVVPSKPKTFEEVKKEIEPLYKEEMTAKALLVYAQKNVASFKGETTDFITVKSDITLQALSQSESKEFINKLFNTQKANDFITLDSGKIVLYNIMEQKMLEKKVDNVNSLLGLKNRIFGEGMLKNLQNRYPTEIFIKGL